MTLPKILIVDDDDIIRDLLSDLLRRDEYFVETASSAEEALEKIRRDFFTLIVTDLKMSSELEGLELLKTIRNMNIDSEVIVITGYGTTDSVVEAIKYGAIDYIEKPFELLEFRDLVTEVIEKRNVQDAAEKNVLLTYLLNIAQFDNRALTYSQV